MNLRVFVVGATGYLGSAIAARLARAGHEVYGLTRSAERAPALAAAPPVPASGAEAPVPAAARREIGRAHV